MDKGNLLSENEFGYRSVHYVVSLSEQRTNLPEWRNLANLKFEIQIRTVLQHAWASISHTLQYKHENDVPTTLKRQLFRLAGLFEIADEEFVNIKKKHNVISANAYDKKHNLSSIEINLHTILKFLSESENVRKLQEIAASIGFIDNNFDYNFDEENNNNFDSMIITYCDIAGIKTIGQLDNFINESLSISYSYLQYQFDASGSGEWCVSNSFLICMLIIGHNLGKLNIDSLVRLGWHKKNAQRVLKISRSLIDNNNCLST